MQKKQDNPASEFTRLLNLFPNRSNRRERSTY